MDAASASKQILYQSRLNVIVICSNNVITIMWLLLCSNNVIIIFVNEMLMFNASVNIVLRKSGDSVS